jgi:transposase InsO family protein
VFIAIKSKKTVAAARSFLNALHKAAPFKIKTLLTDNGREFTDHAFGWREKDASGEHEFDALCQALGIEHRLTKPRHPQTNGMVERFNGRLAQVLKSHRYRFVWLYNEHLPQRALDLNTPIQALKKWQATHPNLFAKRVVNHPGPDT